MTAEQRHAWCYTLIGRFVVGRHGESDRFALGNLRWMDAVTRPADGHQATVGDERSELETDDVLQQLENRHDGRHQRVRHDQVRYLYVTSSSTGLLGRTYGTQS